MTVTPPPVEPPSARGTVFRDVAGFAGSQYVLRFATLIKGFVVARLLGPAGNGLWQHFIIVSEYAQYAHLGSLAGLNKVLGHRVGAGDEEAARAARSTGTAAVTGTALLLWAGMVAWVILRWDTLEPYDRWGLPILGGIVVLEQVNFTWQALLRAYSRIRLISVVSTVFAFANLAVSLALLPKFGVVGLLAGWLLTRLATTAWLVRRSGFGFRFAIDGPTLRALFATGLPIFFFHLTRVGLRNIDRVLVDRVLDHADLGIYGIAVTLSGLVRYVADAVGFVIYPIFLRRWGETRNPRAMAGRLVHPTELLSIGVPIVLGLSWLVLHLPVLWLLPEYVASIEIYRLLTFSMAFSCLAILPGFYLMAIDRQNWLVPMGLGVIAFDYFVGREMIARGWGLPGVAATMGAGGLAYAAAVLMYAGRWALGSTPRALAWTGKVLLPIAWCAVLVAAVSWLGGRAPLAGWTETGRSLAQGALFLGLTAPLLVAFERRHGVLATLRGRPDQSSAPSSSSKSDS